MLAGHDFDALLMGSLYGELSAVEESRLQAHLEAHPGDQELWRGLQRTREAIRSSAALVVVEPPQAISARILQEAARRAPKVPAGELAQGGLAARVGRWLATFAAHPALAAAAMAVVAVGVAGTMYARGKGEASSPKVASESPPALAEGAAAAPTPPTDSPTASATASALEPAVPESVPAPEPTAGDSFAVGLANEPASADPKRELQVAKGKADGKLAQDLVEPSVRRRQAEPTDQAAKPSKVAAKPAPKNRDYLQASTEEYEVPLKDLADEDRKEASPAESSAADDFAAAPPLVIAGRSESEAPRQAKQPAPSANTARAGAVAAKPQAPAAPPPASAPASPVVEAGGAAADVVDKAEGAVGSDDKWAAGEHARLRRLARANKCSEAAAVARAIAERAPRYYAARVTDDKELRACSSAIRDALNLRPDAKRKATRAGEADVRK